MKTDKIGLVLEPDGEALRMLRGVHACGQPAIDIDPRAAIDRWQS